MKKIFIRSPYFIQVNYTAQLGSKLELYFYNQYDPIPAEPTYTLTKKIASFTQTENSWNISNYAKGFIKQINANVVASPTEENVKNWCYCLVRKLTELTPGTYTILDEETFVCLNGYTNYLDGYNNYTDDEVVLLFNPDIQRLKTIDLKNVNIFSDALVSLEWNNNDGYYPFTPEEANIYSLNLSEGSNQLFVNSVEVLNINVEEVCEPKYTPVECTYVNRFGGWEFLTFFKANSQSIEVTNKEFNLLPNAIYYNVLQGKMKSFNQQGKQKIKCNTGWVNENYFELIQDLLLSETVLLDNKPVIVKSQSSEIKTHLKDKNINYEIEFEFNYGLINDVI